MYFTVVKRVGGDHEDNRKYLCKMNGPAFLEPGELVIFGDSDKHFLVGKVLVPSFNADVAAVLDAWELTIDRVRTVKVILQQYAVADDRGDGGQDEMDAPVDLPEV